MHLAEKYHPFKLKVATKAGARIKHWMNVGLSSRSAPAFTRRFPQ